MKTKLQALKEMKQYFTDMKETCIAMLELIERDLKAIKGKKYGNI